MRNCMDEKHSNVPHIRKNPAIKQVTANYNPQNEAFRLFRTNRIIS